MTLAEGPARLSPLSTIQAVLRPTPSAAACLAVVSSPLAIKAARICASFEACLAFALRFLMPLRMGHPAHRFVSLLVFASVVRGLCCSFLGAPPLPGFFGCISVKNVTNAGRQLGICQHAFGRLGI